MAAYDTALQTLADAMPIGIAVYDGSEFIWTNAVADDFMLGPDIMLDHSDAANRPPTQLVGVYTGAFPSGKFAQTQWAGVFVTKRGDRIPVVMIRPTTGPVTFLIGCHDEWNIRAVDLRRIYGLTEPVSRAVALWSEGYSIEQVADELNISFETARRHIGLSRSAIGASDRSEVAMAILTGPAPIMTRLSVE